MLTQKFEKNIVKLLNAINDSGDVVTCKLIIINNDEFWKKNIKDAIKESIPCSNKNYNISCEVLNGDVYIKSDFNGSINLQIDNILSTIYKLECMIITFNDVNLSYNKEKGMLEKAKHVYVILQN